MLQYCREINKFGAYAALLIVLAMVPTMFTPLFSVAVQQTLFHYSMVAASVLSISVLALDAIMLVVYGIVTVMKRFAGKKLSQAAGN